MDFPSPISSSPLQNLNQSSTPSSRTTSPSASPTTNHRQPTSPHHLFNLSFHPTSNNKDDETSFSTQNPHTISVLPCAVLRGRSSMMLLRRRPSAVDMALSEERSRCDGNAIERQGLDLMEPRPVDMRIDVGVGSSLGGFVNATGNSSGNTFAAVNSRTTTGRGCMSYQHRQSLKNQSSNSTMNANANQSQPPFVMGGIFEVMEGRA